MVRRLLDRHESIFQRALEILPGSLAWGIILFPAIGGFFFPQTVAYAVLIFLAYWFYRSFQSAILGIRGYFLLKQWENTDWLAEWKKSSYDQKLNFNEIYHVVIIPNYNESAEKIAGTLTSLASQKQINLKRMIIFLAMEKRAEDAKERADYLIKEFKTKFGGLYATYHPDNIPGEVRGKASNETWAAKVAEKTLAKRKIKMDKVTVTSCDADTNFHALYFASLTYHFAVNPEHYVRFWQSPIFWYNNLAQVPFPIRIVGVIGHAIHLASLQEPTKLIFNYSCYSLSFKLVRQVGYWHTDIIPEDWHLFLQTFFATSGQVEVQPIFLPTNIDAAQSKTWLGSLKNRYEQCKRHAWGASDIPYAVKEAIRHPEIPLSARILRIYKLIETHLIWSTNWFILTLGATLPVILNPAFARTALGYNLPKLSQFILTVCLIALLVMIVIDLVLRPKYARPASIFAVIREVLQWVSLPIATLFMSVLPGLDAHTRLLLGRRLEYRVTEKV
ncbi:glycosyltransferase family 2 protein [Candidatus Microgenomates bacterium]|nr:glycosyltransferase family 2 protein [Candidatus Microgenomates bacterium]